MIPESIVDKLKDRVLAAYSKAYSKLGKTLIWEDWVDYFEEYENFNLLGDLDSFIIYDSIGHVCKVIDVVSTNGKAYQLWSELVKRFDIIITWAYDDLPIVKRTYKKLGYIGTGIYNNLDQQLYIRDPELEKRGFMNKEITISEVGEISIPNDLSSLEMRNKILDFEQKLSKVPDAVFGDSDKCPLKHSFADGIYVREIFIPKGYTIVGKIHKHSHPNFLMKGKVSVVTESNGVEILEAPMSMISPAATKRVVYAHEDTVWITVHKTESKDLEIIEDEVIAKTFDELPEFCVNDIKKLSGGKL